MTEEKAREAVLKILRRAEEGVTYTQELVNSTLIKGSFSPEDERLIAELSLGVMRRRNTLDWLIESCSSRKASKMTPWIRNILRMGAYQLIFLDRIPPFAATNESVKLAHRFGHSGTVKLVNGVLRRLASKNGEIPYPSLDEEPALHIGLKFSHPQWLVKRWIERFGIDETISLCEVNNEVPPLTFRTNTLKVKRDELISILAREGVDSSPSSFPPEGIRILDSPKITGLKSFQEGLFYPQDESAMLASHLLSPKQGEFILDLCSAPGGKATHLAQLMENRGKILAVDKDAGRLKLVEENCRRLGITIVETLPQYVRKLNGGFEAKADRVLLDVPCSNLGVLRRRIEAKWRSSPEGILNLKKLQLELLKSCAKFLKRDGILVYSTCTLAPEENEEVIEKFLEEVQGFKVDFPPFAKDFLTEDGFLRTFPHRHKMDGIFLARLRRGKW